MKIKKTSAVKASSEVFDQPLLDTCAGNQCNSTLTQVCDCKYQCAIDLILAAIESLAESAKDDPLAKDSIANLGVVMLDLKGGC